MKNLSKQMYVPANLNVSFEQYNNGFVIWMAGPNASYIRYLEMSNSTSLSAGLLMSNDNSSLKLHISSLGKNQYFYNLLKAKALNQDKIYINVIRYQLNQIMTNIMASAKKYLILRGVGYKFFRQKSYLSIQLSFSHKVNIILPSYICTKLNRKSTAIRFKTNYQQDLNSLLAKIRNIKQPDVYKGKGIRYKFDKTVRKEGKKKKIRFKLMPTRNQLLHKSRQKRVYKNRRPDLEKCPQKKATCLRVYVMTPRKPNSALRKVAWIFLNSNALKVHAYIPGMGHTLQKHSVVLIRGGRVKDLPGMKYTIIRGKFDLKKLFKCRKARSKYGTKKTYTRVDHRYRKYQYW